MDDFEKALADAGEKTGVSPLIIEMEAQNDRGAAIVGAAIVEQALEHDLVDEWKTMSKRLRERLFSGYGPLSAFSSKIDIARAMNLISQSSWADAHNIRRIRNEAAHVGGRFEFSSKSTRDLVSALLIPRYLPNDELAGGPERNAFTTTVRVLTVIVTLRRLGPIIRPKHMPADYKMPPMDVVTLSKRSP